MKTNKGKLKKDYILNKAEELFLSKGYSSSTIADIVQHSGVSKGSIYYYYNSKETYFLILSIGNQVNGYSFGRKKRNHTIMFLINSTQLQNIM